MTMKSKLIRKFLKKYAPSVNSDDYSVLVAYMNVHAVELVLKKCGDQLIRENLIRQATSLHEERVPMMLPGISNSTSDVVLPVVIVLIEHADLGLRLALQEVFRNNTALGFEIRIKRDGPREVLRVVKATSASRNEQLWNLL
jgi:hypothetical protein